MSEYSAVEKGKEEELERSIVKENVINERKDRKWWTLKGNTCIE